MRNGRPDGKHARVGKRVDAAFGLRLSASRDAAATTWRLRATWMAFWGGRVGVQGVGAAVQSGDAEVEHSLLGASEVVELNVRSGVPEQ